MGTRAAFVPFSAPDIGEAEVEAVTRTLRSGWITTGPESAAFEQEFADFVGGEVHAVAVSSATAGLHLALEAVGVTSGDEVIVPTWTFTASAEIIRYLGATPVIVDVCSTTLNIDVNAIRDAITPRTKAVVVVHFAGLSVDLAPVRAALKGTGVFIVEDAAHALPSEHPGVPVGSALHSDAVVFSFYANKTMTTGEGGMVTTRSRRLAERMRIMRLHGIDRDVFDRYRSEKPGWLYDVVAPGYKYNLTDLAAAIGRVQLGRVRQMADRRRALASLYRDAFHDLPLRMPAGAEEGGTHAWHLFVVRLTDQARLDRRGFIDQLARRGIGSSVHFIPLHRLSYWRESLEVDASAFPAAEDAFPRVVSLPLFSRMTDAQAEQVVAAVRETLG